MRPRVRNVGLPIVRETLRSDDLERVIVAECVVGIGEQFELMTRIGLVVDSDQSAIVTGAHLAVQSGIGFLDRPVDRTRVDETHEVLEVAFDVLDGRRKIGYQLTFQTDKVLIDIRLLDIRIDAEVGRRRSTIDLVEDVRSKHLRRDVGVLLREVHELELAAEERIRISAVVRPQNRFVIAS